MSTEREEVPSGGDSPELRGLTQEELTLLRKALDNLDLGGDTVEHLVESLETAALERQEDIERRDAIERQTKMWP